MPVVDMSQQEQQPGQGQGYTESAEEKAGWQDMLKYLASMRPPLIKDGTFTVKGYIKEFLLAPGDKYFVSQVEGQDGKEKPWQHVKAVVCIADDRVSQQDLPLPPKNVGANFFDGWTQKGRSNLRGGMYNVHLAVTHQEPPQDLVQGSGRWNTDDYAGPEHPILVRVQYGGLEPKESKYYGRRGNLRLFVHGFERDPDFAADAPNELAAALAATDDPGDTMQEPEPAPKPVTRRNTGRTSGASTAASAPVASPTDDDDSDFFSQLQTEPAPTRGRRSASNAGAAAGDSAPVASTATVSASDPNPTVQRATERQVKFIFAIAREAGMDEQELTTWSQELYGQEVSQLNRRDASTLIEALQRRHNEVA